MRTEVFLDRRVPADRREAVRQAFQDRELTIDREGPLALKSLEFFDLRIDVAFILGATIGGALWDVEKDLLRRAIAAVRAVWSVSGMVTVDHESRPPGQPPTVYLVPGGPESETAFDAIEADYEGAPPGVRVWLPAVGWVDSKDLGPIMDGAKDRLEGKQQ